MDQLSQLKKMTTVVADTGDIEAIKKFSPQDATTNPSLILKAAETPQYAHFLEKAVEDMRQKVSDEAVHLHKAGQYLSALIGAEVLKFIPGKVSTELDARLSFDANATVNYAKELIEIYRQLGVPRERVLLKISGTWEGIEAVKALEKVGIQCNVTLIFHFAQAVACAQAGATLISPFVGRIYDWYQQQGQIKAEEKDPGVSSVENIFNYYRKFNYKTIVMGASFRHIGQIQALAGCDYLTISPLLLEKLQMTQGFLPQKLSPALSMQCDLSKMSLTEPSFRWALNESAMATEKLAEGIRLFSKDTVLLEALLKNRL